jgi:hypothetical protein
LHQLAHGNLPGAFKLNALLVLGLLLGGLIAGFRKQNDVPGWCAGAVILAIVLFGVVRNIPMFPFTLLAP